MRSVLYAMEVWVPSSPPLLSSDSGPVFQHRGAYLPQRDRPRRQRIVSTPEHCVSPLTDISPSLLFRSLGRILGGAHLVSITFLVAGLRAGWYRPLSNCILPVIRDNMNGTRRTIIRHPFHRPRTMIERLLHDDGLK